jgi:tetratricopeptide (TPR) repeat protein
MHGVLFLLFMLVLGAGEAAAADDPVQKALKAYEKHQYETAARDLRTALPSLSPAKQTSARLALGMIYLKSGELHRAFAGVSLAVNTDYLKRLSRETGRDRSRYADLHLGLACLEAGRSAEASASLKQFLAGPAASEARYADIARIALGRAAVAEGGKDRARQLWGGIAAADPEVRSELASARSLAGMDEQSATAFCDEAAAGARRTDAPLPVTVVTNCLGIYAKAGLVDRGLDLLARADLRSPSQREAIGRSKVITFYDLGLLRSLSDLYLQAGIASLEKAAADQQLNSVANFYLGEAYLLAGSRDQAAKATAAALSSQRLPQPYRDRALVRQAAIQYEKGGRAGVLGTWDELSRGPSGDAELLGDILSSCGRLRIDCPRIEQSSLGALERGEGRKLMALNAALGRYYTGKKEYPKALVHLDAGRDKGNKNKIESNDPLLLVELADAGCRAKKFSEALEIYFEMSKQFPQVRQIQEAVQGIYSMEQKSAGDVKIN